MMDGMEILARASSSLSTTGVVDELHVPYYSPEDMTPMSMTVFESMDCFMGVEEEVVNTTTGFYDVTTTVSSSSVDYRVAAELDTSILLMDHHHHDESDDVLLEVKKPSYLDVREQEVGQRQFTKGWDEIRQKVSVMNRRTGSKAFGHAIYRNMIHFLEKSHHDTNNDDGPFLSSSGSLDEGRDTYTSYGSSESPEASAVETDHRYAAVILTQKQSSPTVRDHQYNQDPQEDHDDDCGGTARKVQAVSFIKRRPKRDRQLVTYLDFIFTKSTKLEEVTGAMITLQVSYDDQVFNCMNYKSAEGCLSERRESSKSTLRRIPVVIEDDDEPSAEGMFMRLQRHSSSEGRNVTIRYDVHSLNFDDDDELVLSPTEQPNKSPSVVDAASNTEPTCTLCHNTKYPQLTSGGVWLRCFHPTCFYIVHPPCVGFQLMSLPQILALPPFLCPSHR